MTIPTSAASVAEPSSTGLSPNAAATLAYVLGPITGIPIFLIEKQSRYVRYHAAQSITASVLMIGVSIALSFLSGALLIIPILGWIAALLITLAISLGSFVLWIVLMWRAWQGQEWEAPVAGTFARRLVA